MAKKQNTAPMLNVRKGATLRAIYAQARLEFTAADLQKYTEIEEGVPMEWIIAEIEAIQSGASRKRNKRV
jgi:hypothetical protein